MRKKLPVLVLAIVILLQALVPAVYAASKNEDTGSYGIFRHFDTPPEGAGKAYDIARQGGKHAGFYNQYLNKSNAEIQKGIQSIEKQIAEHQEKIANPENYIPSFRQLDPRQQEALITKIWPSDIQRQMEQKDILEGILRGR